MYPYYLGYGMDFSYLFLMLVCFVIGAGAQFFIKKAYNHYLTVPSRLNTTGAELARRMLNEGGASNIDIQHIDGRLTDNFNPQEESLFLSQDNFSGGSVASIAVACHEAGHAVQRAHGYLFYRLRTALVPVVNIAQNIWIYLLILGFALRMFGLVQLALILFGSSIVFHLLTLPVEIDASRRALAFIKAQGSEIDYEGSKQVLTAAALTYVAGALVSVLQFIYMMSRYNSRD